MCGRFALYSPYPKLSQSLRLPLESGEPMPRCNVVPGTLITTAHYSVVSALLVLGEV